MMSAGWLALPADMGGTDVEPGWYADAHRNRMRGELIEVQ